MAMSDTVIFDPEYMNILEDSFGVLLNENYSPVDIVRHRLITAACFIEEDISRGVLPEDVSGFSDIHDYVDANMYLINEGCTDPKVGSFYEWEGWSVDRICAHFNIIIEALDAWLKQKRSKPVTAYMNLTA